MVDQKPACPYRRNTVLQVHEHPQLGHHRETAGTAGKDRGGSGRVGGGLTRIGPDGLHGRGGCCATCVAQRACCAPTTVGLPKMTVGAGRDARCSASTASIDPPLQMSGGLASLLLPDDLQRLEVLDLALDGLLGWQALDAGRAEEADDPRHALKRLADVLRPVERPAMADHKLVR